MTEQFTEHGRRLQAKQFTSSQPPLRRRWRRQALPVHTGDEPLPLLGTDLPAYLACLGPDELAPVESAQAHPDARAVPAHQLEPRAAPVGEHVGRAIAWRAPKRMLHV